MNFLSSKSLWHTLTYGSCFPRPTHIEMTGGALTSFCVSQAQENISCMHSSPKILCKTWLVLTLDRSVKPPCQRRPPVHTTDHEVTPTLSRRIGPSQSRIMENKRRTIKGETTRQGSGGGDSQKRCVRGHSNEGKQEGNKRTMASLKNGLVRCSAFSLLRVPCLPWTKPTCYEEDIYVKFPSTCLNSSEHFWRITSWSCPKHDCNSPDHPPNLCNAASVLVNEGS